MTFLRAALGAAVVATVLGAPTGAAASVNATAADLLAGLPVAAEVRTGYDRDLFTHWIDADGNGCDTRREVLQAESLTPVVVTGTCTIVSGQWYSAFDGATWTDPADVDIDHLVPLAEAWDSGARTWSEPTRRAFANDLAIPDSLIAVTDSVNQSKSDGDPADWMPPLTSARCDYAVQWVTVKTRWRLSVDPAEQAALADTLSGSCGARVVGAPPDGSPTQDGPTSFVDVSGSHVFRDEITWLAGQRVTTGYTDGTFRPGQPVLREQMAAFLYRLRGEPAVQLPPTSPFTDVPTTHVFYRQMVWLKSQNITTGYDNGNGTISFRPGQPVLREQMAAFLRRLEANPPVAQPSSRPFTDVATSHVFHLDIVWLAREGITTGYDTGFGCREYRPSAAVLREQMAAFLFRLENGGTTPLLDGSACQPPPPPPPGNPVPKIPGTNNCPAFAPIKGNASSMIYHVPGGGSYNVTNPEQCFRSEVDAVAAGYRAARN
ncbi:hypothetical protein HMPREF0063_10477 [Aeromicrobium marinum DSM 15272]|uniref:SLH domain-containing protein n=1 Tax=Aeromicrobium marinum DSM 15272 TaxID=585531 RepID=E2S8W9_9ACTN|nr:S-layer homology domain-containing protein [Aeromicrobium marinum]EFQ84624.1 hypothetical protein HMPREF0063_10477 [Aeromicrobium marinum DSM 15272]